MTDDARRDLADLAAQFPRARWQFEMQVEAAAAEVTEIAKSVSTAIGDISVDEAIAVIIREFTERMHAPRSYGEFKGRSTS